jgi:hypothetical protein
LYGVIGNKSDMDAQQAVTIQQGEEFTQKSISNSFFAQVSAKENDGITEMFQTFAEKLYLMQLKKFYTYIISC